MSDVSKLTMNVNVPPTLLTIAAADGRTLLEINRDGTVSGSLGDAGEAAERFVEFVRRSLGGGVGSVTGERGSDVSITDLIAALRRKAGMYARVLGGGKNETEILMTAAADALESVTAPTKNERERVLRIVGAAVYGDPADLSRASKAVHAIFAAGFRLPVPVELTDDVVERAAQAMFEDPLSSAEYSWAEMVVEDRERADIWRGDARRVLAAAALPIPETGEAEVVTLCGSTQFKDAFNTENSRLTMEGKLVISVGVFGHSDLPGYDWSTDTSDLKRKLDRLHFQKIDMASRVHVVNPGGYIGESTRREIAYAESRGKRVTFMVEVSS